MLEKVTGLVVLFLTIVHPNSGAAVGRTARGMLGVGEVGGGGGGGGGGVLSCPAQCACSTRRFEGLKTNCSGAGTGNVGGNELRIERLLTDVSPETHYL